MKRFWTTVAVVDDAANCGVTLDGRRLKTPARVDLKVPTRALAEAIAAEWDGCGPTIDPRSMPLTGLANAAIDRVEPDPATFAAALIRYAEADLTCYRADAPSVLVERQAESWDALLGWARQRFDVDFAVGDGIVHIPQPPSTVARLASALEALDPWRLAALSPLVTIGGSLVAALAVIEAAMPAEATWEAVSLDERWQLEKWGADDEAEVALDNKRRDFLAAARFVELLG